MVSCDVCKAKRRGVKRLSLYRMPAVLVVQIKRFRFSTVARDKIMTDVTFPVQGLDLASFASQDRLPPGAGGAGDLPPGAQATIGVPDCNPGGLCTTSWVYRHTAAACTGGTISPTSM